MRRMGSQSLTGGLHRVLHIEVSCSPGFLQAGICEGQTNIGTETSTRYVLALHSLPPLPHLYSPVDQSQECV